MPPTVKPHRTSEHQWVIRCPYCHLEHFHGIGTGHRVAHCTEEYKPNDGYILTQP